MEVSKTALAVALSTGLLFGCDFDVGPDSGSDGGSDGGSTPTSALVGPLWNFEDASGASTQAIGLPNIYVFDGTNLKYYNDDATPNTYEITLTPYTDDAEAGEIMFTFYDDAGVGSEVSGTYTVDNGVLTVDTASEGVLIGADDTSNADIKAAVDAANADAGFNNYVQIIDTLDTDTGELRLKLSDNDLDPITSGKLTVDLTHQVDEDSVGDVNSKNAYISFYASGTSTINMHGEIALEAGKIKYRDNNKDLVEIVGSYTEGEELKIEANWDDGVFNFKVNDVEHSYTSNEIPENGPVEIIAIRLGDNGSTNNYEVLADNLKVYSNDGGSEALVFEDNFDSYAVDTVLNSKPYNNNSSEATVRGTTPPPAEEEPEVPVDPVDPDFPVADFAWDFSAVDGGSVVGSKALTISKDGDNPKVLTDGAVDVDGAVHTTQSVSSGTYGYYYTVMEGTTDPLAFTDGTFSMEIVFSVDDITFNPTAGQDLQLLENTDSNTGYKLIIDKSSLKPKLRIYDGSGSSSVEAETTIANGEYMHVVATFDNGTGKVYVNGVEEGTASELTFVPNTKDGDKVYVGGGSNSSQKNLEGALDNAAFFNDVLTAEEVKLRAAEFGFTTN
ncbi:LamG domain-containing protein [Vibrio breoganii]|uniref:LamG domain-containing protein n=1 Tax=Vibrio breoganii TaxID=553239 RepID=UPI0021C3B06B|nr:LamG domain-containing protein [Vibrio breoganii]MDN3715061.1 LamG domain-containing protein [Vibrio breoganii]